ncbi:hypothetical protein ACFC09_04445 [Streptomyces sp. NPDC056161]|uniref:hypothetical protein n=1 Tax=Streptomyces sp. NPDC056161 TaxID=3345732 RepID=UPI0035DD40D3
MTDRAPEAALADPATLRAWKRARRRATAATVFWVLSLPGFFVLATIGWESFVGDSLPVYAVIILVLVSVVGIAVSDVRRVQLKKMRGILATYPWLDHPPLKAVVPADLDYLKVPHPDEPGRSVSVVVRRYGLSGKRWRKAMTNARSQGFKFAGDPRFGAVIALDGPGELGFARPTHVLNPSKGTRPVGVSEGAWERAQAAGVSGESPFTEEEQSQLNTARKRGSRA